MNYIIGKYKRTIYQTENGYIVGLFKIKDNDIDECHNNRIITFTGYFSELNYDDEYKFLGEFTKHPKYGEQFTVTSFEIILPKEKNSIVEFLSSDLFKGIGEKTAERIVDTLGENALKIIMENPNNLLLVKSINEKQAKLIYKKLHEYENNYQTLIYLAEIGFNTKDSGIIYRKYRENTMTIIEENIYHLMEIETITFKKLDQIAKKMEILPNDQRRIKGGILYTMDEVCNLFGHSYLFKEEIFNFTNRSLNTLISEIEFDEAINSLLSENKIMKITDNYYLCTMYQAEMNITNRISYLNNLPDNKDKLLDKKIKLLENYFSINYNSEQLTAIRDSYLKNFLIITGGPGTGKTTIIKGIVELYRQINDLDYEQLINEIALLAPTGRAAKRIAESTVLPATTIHRFLKWNKESNKFGVNEYSRSIAKLVIVDEASMIDTYLLDNLLKGLKSSTRIILIGDYNQLPSVGPGQILKDLIDSEQLSTIKLEQLYRQKEGNNILTLAHNINKGILYDEIYLENDDYHFIETNTDNLKQELIKLINKYKASDYQKFQIMAPMYKTYNGIDNLNLVIREILNPQDKRNKEIVINEVIYREKDKIIQLTNMPDDNVYNGDIGIIEKIMTSPKKEIYINFEGNLVKYTASNFNNFKHGYVISIHKAQGSEFETVVIPLVREYKKMLYRKLVYTAVTRAKNELYILGEKQILKDAILKDETDVRRTTIRNMLIDKYNNISLTHNNTGT